MGYVVEWEEEEEGARPVIQQPTKRSPVMEAIEKRHLDYQKSVGFLTMLPAGHKTRWASRVILVQKPKEDLWAKAALGAWYAITGALTTAVSGRAR